MTIQYKLAKALLCATLFACAPAWAVNKCTGPDGKTAYQDGPCTGGKGEKMVTTPASGYAVREPAPPAPTPVPTAAPPVLAPPPPAASAVPTKSLLETQADACLAWYKPLLRDPASAYYSEHKFEDKRVLRMDIHAKNGYGGVQILKGVCEFENGKLSDSWTKLQAKRMGW